MESNGTLALVGLSVALSGLTLGGLTACGEDDPANPTVEAACTGVSQAVGGETRASCMEYTVPQSSKKSMEASCGSPSVSGTWIDDGSCPTDGLIGTCESLGGGLESNQVKTFFYADWTEATGSDTCTGSLNGDWTKSDG